MTLFSFNSHYAKGGNMSVFDKELMKKVAELECRIESLENQVSELQGLEDKIIDKLEDIVGERMKKW